MHMPKVHIVLRFVPLVVDLFTGLQCCSLSVYFDIFLGIFVNFFSFGFGRIIQMQILSRIISRLYSENSKSPTLGFCCEY